MKKADKNLTAGERRLAEAKETPRGPQSKALEKAKPTAFRQARQDANSDGEKRPPARPSSNEKSKPATKKRGR